MSQQDQNVVIAGAGVAGTVAALALRKAGIEVTVIEARPAGRDEGPVVRLNPNAMDALRAVDAHQAVIAASFPLLRSETYSSAGRRIGYELAADPASERGMPRVLTRERLTGILRELAGQAGAEFRRDERVADVEHVSGGVRAVLAGGEKIEGTALVGADGARSTLRRHLNPDGPEPQYTGTRTSYGFTPRPTFEPPPAGVLQLHLGAQALFASLRDPVTGGCFWFANRTASSPGDDSDPQPREHLQKLFAADPAPGAAAVEGADHITTFDDHALPHLPRWRDDRVVVIGDAAHVTSPVSGQGAGMAIEDGVVLARCLRDAPDASGALGAFERLRRERAETVVALGASTLRRAHERGVRRRLRHVADRVRSLVPGSHPTAGPKWTHSHHITWDEPTVRR